MASSNPSSEPHGTADRRAQKSAAGGPGNAADPSLSENSLTTSVQATLPPQRLLSMDTYRGFVMFLMAAEMLRLSQLAKNFPGSRLWEWIDFHNSHVAWTGCSLHDLIQPSFSFLVGVALPFSLASRKGRGQSILRMTLHAFVRGALLVLLGVFLRSTGREMTRWTFEDTLSQIGLGYPILFLLGLASFRIRWIALAVILVGYWAFFAAYPIPGPEWSRAAANVSTEWSHDFSGFAAHWNLNANAAWNFDRWFLNLFPRESEFLGNGGGYSTLNFIPTLGTMLLGLIAGQWVRDTPGKPALLRLLISGIVCLLLGYGLHLSGLCPSVKKIWTPSWTLQSGGWCFLMLMGFHAVTDVIRLRFWAWPLAVIGMNSIAMYCMVHLISGFIQSSLKIHLGSKPFLVLGEPWEATLRGAATLGTLWLILLWMYRRRLFLRL
ncbi:MAG: acyltransferase family protein [Planctomyces sp.]